MKIINWLMIKLGYVRCIKCNRWTEPSIVFGAVCSIKCLYKIN